MTTYEVLNRDGDIEATGLDAVDALLMAVSHDGGVGVFRPGRDERGRFDGTLNFYGEVSPSLARATALRPWHDMAGHHDSRRISLPIWGRTAMDCAAKVIAVHGGDIGGWSVRPIDSA